MTQFRFQPALAVLFGLSLAGCSAIGSTSDEARAPGGLFNPGNYSSLDKREGAATTRGRAPVAALPSAAGRVVDVREKRFGNGLRQEIALAADSGVRGENVILVSMRDQPIVAWGQSEIDMPKDREDEIAAEIETRLPGAGMRIHDQVLRNGYGSYGLATGRQGSANCVFLWQSMNDLKDVGRVAASPYKIETAVRVRLCRAGVPLSTLARWASSYVVDPNGAGQAPGYAQRAGDPLADALDEPGAARGAYGGTAAPSFEDEEVRPRRVVAAPRRARVWRAPRRTRVVSVRRREEPAQQAAPAQAAPAYGYAQPYGQAAPAAPAYAAGYAQPGQVVWTQPGAQAIARTAAPAYGGSAAPAAGSVGLPPQAFTGPSSQTYVAPR